MITSAYMYVPARVATSKDSLIDACSKTSHCLMMKTGVTKSKTEEGNPNKAGMIAPRQIPSLVFDKNY